MFLINIFIILTLKVTITLDRLVKSKDMSSPRMCPRILSYVSQKMARGRDASCSCLHPYMHAEDHIFTVLNYLPEL